MEISTDGNDHVTISKYITLNAECLTCHTSLLKKEEKISAKNYYSEDVDFYVGKEIDLTFEQFLKYHKDSLREEKVGAILFFLISAIITILLSIYL